MLTDIVRQLFDAIEHGDLAALDALYDADAVQVEFPNALLPQGARRDKAALLAATRRGAALLASQSLVIAHALERDDTVALEAEWTGRLAIDAPPLGLKAGDDMRARFAQFLTFRAGRIVRHHTYDCFAPWTAPAALSN